MSPRFPRLYRLFYPINHWLDRQSDLTRLAIALVLTFPLQFGAYLHWLLFLLVPGLLWIYSRMTVD